MLCVLIPCLGGSRAGAQPAVFPYFLLDTKPDGPLSTAMQRLYDDYLAPTPEASFPQGLGKQQREQRAKAACQPK